MDKDIEEKWQNFFKTLEPRIIKLENSYEDMSNLFRSKVESVKFSEHFPLITTKIEESESNIASLKGLAVLVHDIRSNDSRCTNIRFMHEL